MTILDLIDGYNLKLQQQGGVYVCFCPFHEDTSRANLTVYPETDSYFCYACKKGGDAADFLSSIENITREQALVRLHEDLGFLLDKLSKDRAPSSSNESLNFLLSKMIGDSLQKNPSKLSEIKVVLQKIDKALEKEVSLEEGNLLVKEVVADIFKITNCNKEYENNISTSKN
jgi:DNA primase